MVHWAPWEKSFARVLRPIDAFIQKQSTSSILLMICTAMALVIANSTFGEMYQELLQKNLSLSIANKTFGMSIQHWINDGLMAIFFLIMGLELKRELLVGELADIRRALLPVIAAVGGMVVPALIYFSANPQGAASSGWGIPMATDIAFAVGALSFLGKRIPRTLIVFLIALAIVDDLGAVLVIALFYTKTIHLDSLLWSVFLVMVLVVMNLGGVRRLLPYLVVGAALWCAMLSSGIHATIAGVLVAFCIPVRPKYNPEHFMQSATTQLQQLKQQLRHHSDEFFYSQLATLERGVELVQAPAARLENALHIYVAYLVIPIFALANAAIPVDLKNMSTQFFNPVELGVIGGLVFGKLFGITGATWIAVKMRIASLPRDLHMHHVIGIGLLGGIGFTMSIFIADLGFAGEPELLLQAKTGILLGSCISASAGMAWLWIYQRR